ncbi:MAG: DUF2309 domain-containing protein, partial [Gammaproteobacteria bacterium]|nr:DUF2309 domain-containing protein [Gammaproteobacteria bacterium]
MNPLAAHSEPLALLTAVQRAGQRIAPTWPLDRMIAVNPWWEWCDQPITDVAARLDALGRVHGLMPEAYYAERWQQGLIRAEHLQQAAAELGETGTTEVWLRALHAPSETAHWHNLSDLLDAARDRQHQMAWRDEITHQISQFCAAFCQQPGHQAAQHLYAHWLRQTRVDHGIAILMGEPGLTKTFATLPADSDALITTALTTLGMDDPALAEAYAQALLLDSNGWASWLAHERWQARLAGQAEDALPQLVAIRLGWELALWRHWHHRHPQTAARLAAQWQRQRQHWPTLLERHREAQRPRWVWMRAAELARQEKEQQRLRQPRTATPATPTLQAVFCIDVRSEVMRRALEAQSSDIQTLGFAGFFGLPLAYAPVGTALARPQLPGLLAPRIQVSEGGHARVALGHQRRRRLEPRLLWDEVSRGAASAFSLVEATGLRYAATLLRQTFAPRAAAHPVNDLPGAESWILSQDGRPLLEDEKADLLAGILRAMNLTVLAQEVLLVGHGSHTTNNPHAAGLDCGACGGQTGEINVRVLAQMLNDEH